MKLPLPQRGQPIDYNWIYRIVDTVNDLTNKIYSKVSVSSVSENSIRSSDLVTYATSISVVATDVDINTEKDFNQSFSVGFQYPPVVTVTVVNPVTGGNSSAGNKAFAVINSVDTTGVSGKIVFQAKGTVNVGVNIIAVGIPKV